MEFPNFNELDDIGLLTQPPSQDTLRALYNQMKSVAARYPYIDGRIQGEDFKPNKGAALSMGIQIYLVPTYDPVTRRKNSATLMVNEPGINQHEVTAQFDFWYDERKDDFTLDSLFGCSEYDAKRLLKCLTPPPEQTAP